MAFKCSALPGYPYSGTMVYIKVETNLPAESVPQGAVQELVRVVSLTFPETAGVAGATIQCNMLGNDLPTARVTCFNALPSLAYPRPRIEGPRIEKDVKLALHMMLGIPPERCSYVHCEAPH